MSIVTSVAKLPQVCFYLLLNVLIFFFKKVQDVITLTMFGKEKVSTVTSFYNLTDTLIDGKTAVPMSTYKGDVVLVTNVASQ